MTIQLCRGRLISFYDSVNISVHNKPFHFFSISLAVLPQLGHFSESKIIPSPTLLQEVLFPAAALWLLLAAL